MKQLPATDVEVGGGDLERMTFVIGQGCVEDIGHFMLLVVDDEWDGHDLVLLISFFLRLVRLLRLMRRTYGSTSAHFAR